VESSLLAPGLPWGQALHTSLAAGRNRSPAARRGAGRRAEKYRLSWKECGKNHEPGDLMRLQGRCVIEMVQRPQLS